MAFGLQVFDENGNTIIDTSSTITRKVYQTVAKAGENGSVTLSDIDGLETAEFSFSIAGDSSLVGAHSVSRSGTTISWTASSGGSVDSVIFVFLYS